MADSDASLESFVIDVTTHLTGENGWSLRDLSRTLEEPGSHPLRDAQARLDLAVRTAYGMPKVVPISL